ncbi:TCP-1/cpn60 chaperonin family protein, partial [Streptococcus suis]
MTYGPCGWTVAVDYSSHHVRSTKSGSTVLEDFQLSDPCEDAGAHLLCHIAQQVQKYAGDGTT